MSDKVKIEGIFEEGYGLIAKKAMRDKNLNVVSKAIYAYLCSYAGKGKDVFPSQKLLCAELGISKNTLGKYIKELKDGGYITVEQLKEKGRFVQNIYTVNIVLSKVSGDTTKSDVSNAGNNKKKIDKTYTEKVQEETPEKTEEVKEEKKDWRKDWKKQWRKKKSSNTPLEIEEILKKYSELELPAFNYKPENYIILKAYRELGSVKLFEALTMMSQSEFVKNNMSVNAIFKTENLKKALNGNFKDKKKDSSSRGNEVKKKFEKPVYEDFTGDIIDEILKRTAGGN